MKILKIVNFIMKLKEKLWKNNPYLCISNVELISLKFTRLNHFDEKKKF
jgi:hypothetical protein